MVEITEEIKRLIEGNALAFATIGEDGNPHCIAVGDVKVVSKNEFLVGDNYMNETKKNIQKNNNVTLAVWSRDWEKDCVGYEFRGTAKYFTKGKWVEMVKKIHEGFPAKGAIIVTINRIKKMA